MTAVTAGLTHDGAMRLMRPLLRPSTARWPYAATAIVLVGLWAADVSPAAAQRDIDLERLADRVWLVENATSVPTGARYVFLADNRVVISVPDAPAVLGTWAEAPDGLVVTQGKVTSRLEVLELTTDRLRLRVTTPASRGEITLVAAVRPPAPPPAAPAVTTTQAPPAPAVPVGSPYRCGADAFRVSFEADKAYLTWADGTSVVLTEVKVADAPASRRTYTDGQIRLVEDTSEAFTRVLFARPGFRPRPCSPAR